MNDALAEALGAVGVEVAHAVITALSTTFDGHTTMAQVLAELSSLKEQIAANRAAVDKALHQKFDHGGEDGA